MANLTARGSRPALSDQLQFEKDPLLQVSGGSSGVHEEDLKLLSSSMPTSTGRTMIVCLAT